MNLSNYLVQTKDVYHIAWEACRELQCDLVASIGDTKGIGTIAPGECFGNWGGDDVWHATEYDAYDAGAWAFPDAIVSAEPPAVNFGEGKQSVDMHVNERSMGMMRLDAAGEAVKSAVRKAAAKLSQKLQAKAKQLIATRVAGGYRFQAMGFRAANRGEVYARSAMSKLVQATLKPKRKRIGIQRISTRAAIKKFGVIKFSWCWAYRAAPGRQPLPAHVWKAHYYARLAKRRKTHHRGHSTGVHVPALGKGRSRPRHEVKLAAAHGTVTQPFSDWDASAAVDELLKG